MLELIQREKNMSLKIGDKIPDFLLVNHDKETLKSEDFLGSKTMFVFMPFPFSSVCDKEICELRDNIDSFKSAETDTVMITVSARPTNEAWANHHGVDFPILADFWPHGEVSKQFGCFDDVAGISLRYTYITDENNVITEIINSDQIGVERDFEDYREKFSIS
tara:strand:+ start:11249 stop:11737 length:489 start_codon:yes stop_codon:yes gene_type:complete